MLKILFWDGNGLCLFTKRLDRGGFVWPRMAGFEGSVDAQSGAARHADRGHRLASSRSASGDRRWRAEKAPNIKQNREKMLGLEERSK